MDSRLRTRPSPVVRQKRSRHGLCPRGVRHIYRTPASALVEGEADCAFAGFEYHLRHRRVRVDAVVHLLERESVLDSHGELGYEVAGLVAEYLRADYHVIILARHDLHDALGLPDGHRLLVGREGQRAADGLYAALGSVGYRQAHHRYLRLHEHRRRDGVVVDVVVVARYRLGNDEAVEDSFMLRNYGAQSGELYKPDSMNIGGGFDMGGFDMGGFSLGGGGADLSYTDDDPDSYSTIWEGEITDTTDADHERVISALRHISEGSELETYMDVDNLLRYMAVHVFSVNEDSLSGMMAHNYYLYEYNGRLNIIPWDYNLALGGMSGSSATSVVNEAIDNAFAGTDFFDTLMEDETYHAQYYEYLRRLVDEYINGGGFDEFYNRVRGQIDALVEADPNAFYTYDEYLEAAETLYELVKLRGESISGQLDGTIPSTSAEQPGSDALIDASHIDLEVMGSMDIGGGGGFGFGGQGGASGTASSGSGGGFDMSQLPEGFDPSEFGGGGLPEDFDPSDFGGGLPEGFDPSGTGEGSNPSSGEETPAESAPAESAAPGGGEAGGGETGGAPSFGSFPGAGSASQSSSASTLAQYAIALAIFAPALIFALLYRRKPRRR